MSRLAFLRTVWLLAATASAQQLAEQISFGHRTPLSSNGHGIPGWAITSSNHNPQVLSDRIILTPPVPGNTRGALWADQTIDSESWTASLEFRASGQYDGGSGNLQLWFVKEKDQVGTSSVYTVGNYDGLALVIDQYGGRGGAIRGFLNDGTMNFQASSSVESLAFGQCSYIYRNLGRNSKITVSSTNGLTVKVDDQDCFSTDKISLPAGYRFGITAATADNPDSFEIHKFVVHTESASGQSTSKQQQQQQPIEQLNQPSSGSAADMNPGQSLSSTAQLTDLQRQLHVMAVQVTNILGELQVMKQRLDTQKNEILAAVPASSNQGGGASVADMNEIKRQLKNIDLTVQRIQKDVEGRDYKEHLTSLQQAVEGVKGTMSGEFSESIGQLISASAPRTGLFIFVVVAVQIMMVGSYIVYKRRRANAPKKYL